MDSDELRGSQDFELEAVTTHYTHQSSSNRTSVLDIETTSEAHSLAVPLPPVDRGFGALAFLFSAWAMDLLLWTYALTYGVFLNYYTTVEFPDSSRTVLALVGSVSTGILYLSSLVLLPILRRFPALKRKMMWSGLVIAVAGLVGAAFVKEPWALLLTQGVVYSSGASILYWPVLTYLFEWFSERKGLANGLIFSGASIGGAFMPYVIQALLDNHGRRTALLVMALLLAVVIGPAIPFAKARLPVSSVVKPKPMNTQFLTQFVFLILFAANLIQALGNFIPVLYLPTFASDIGVVGIGTTTIALYNGSSAFGQIMIGHLADRSDLRISISMCAIGSMISILLVWGLSVFSNAAPIIVFSLVFGFFSPSWASLWPKFASVVAGDDAATAMALFVSGRGLGNILSAPIAEGLMHTWAGTGKTRFAYGLAGYGPLIIFTAATQLGSIIGVAYKYFEPKNKQVGR